MDSAKDTLLASKKAIAAALVMILVSVLRGIWPDLADGAMQDAIRGLIEILLVVAVVWLTPNKVPTDAK